MSVYHLTLRTLSPLHIGDGDELKQDFDFVAYKNQTWRLNEDAVLMDKEAVLRPDANGHYPPPGKLLAERDFGRKDLFRYILRGIPRSTRTDARVKSFIKDIQDRPYVPGSSLKGALRTALAWNGWAEVNPDLNAIGRNRSWAGQPLERRIFGGNPNLDLMRAVHVADLFGPQEAGGSLVLVNAQVLTKKSAGSPIELEAIPGDITFEGSLTVDETLFSPIAEPILHFGNRKHWLEELIQRTQAHSLARLRALAEWFDHADNTDRIAAFYHNLINAALSPNQALVQIGWGAGWDGKTFWSHLQHDKRRFERIVQDFRLHRAGRNSPPRKEGDPFPRSKRAAMVIREGIPRPAAPFGWAVISVEPTNQTSKHFLSLSKTTASDRNPPAPSPVEKTEASTPARPPQPAPQPPAAVPPKTARGEAKPPPVDAYSKTRLPAPGERFVGEVFDGRDLKLLLVIPGLDPEKDGYALVEAVNNRGGIRFRDGLKVMCEALRLEEESQGYWCVHCQSAEMR